MADQIMRLFVFLLALLLPLQLSWAAVAAYCQPHKERQQQEREQRVSHLGHHEHQEYASAAGGADDAKAGESDADCSLCPFSCAKPMQAERTALLLLPAAALTVLPVRLPHPDSHIAEGPDKPNWLLAA